MKHPHWSEISDYFKEVEQQKERIKSKKLNSEVLTTSKNSLAISLNQLKNNLKQTLDEHSVHHIVFALTALLDEEMQRVIIATNQSAEWLPLQKELFNMTNAGEMFFDNLDEVLESPQFPSIVYEAFYFVLKKGFRGKYQNSQNRLLKYTEFLSDKMQQSSLAKKEKGQQIIQPLPKIKMKIWQYYASAAALLVAFYVALVVQTNL